jgi:predicted ArsR family transcriptional regulator
MAEAGIPERVRDLITRQISSVEQVELLLLLRRLEGQELSAEDASAHLRTTSHSSRIRLDELVRTGLVSVSGGRYRYAAADATDETVAELERYYATHRTRMISLIFHSPSEAVRDFADSFRLRRDS